jgi:hypothetical protein
LPRHLLRHPRSAAPMLGSSLREATGTGSVTKSVSQCEADLIVVDQARHTFPVLGQPSPRHMVGKG